MLIVTLPFQNNLHFINSQLTLILIVSKCTSKYEAKLLPMKSEDVEADRDADCDIAIAQQFAFHYFTNSDLY